jgi:hypothetical protein
MKKASSTSSKKNFDYPEKTAGSKIARKLRSETNSLSESEREDLFKQGMQIIYGGPCKKQTTRTGR